MHIVHIEGMRKSRTKHGRGLHFPHAFEKNGRTGRIQKWKNGTFGTYFRFAGMPHRNNFKTYEAALEYLDREFSTLDTDAINSRTLNPLRSNLKMYSELEQHLLEHAPGTTMPEAINFFIVHRKTKQFQPLSVTACTAKFVEHQRTQNISEIQITTLEKHFRRFNKDFGSRMIHEITTGEFSVWIGKQSDKKTGIPWGVKTRKSVRGSLVSLSIFARDDLKAIPDLGKTEFQKFRAPKDEEREAVEIYSPDEMEKQLLAALENNIELIPALVTGGFEGLRPFEFHAEGLKRKPLPWEALNWNDALLHVQGQKIRSKATRDIPFHPVAAAWLRPFEELTGAMWRHVAAYTKAMSALRKNAGVKSIYDGLRHSYASYRIRILKGDLAKLASEMGNSPAEIVDSYKRNVTDAEAEAYFGKMPPEGYAEKIMAFLRLRNVV